MRESAKVHASDAKIDNDEKTVPDTRSVSIATDTSAIEDTSNVGMDGPWGSVSEERANIDGCVSKRVQCAGKMREFSE